jgi:hypothetical protein
MAQSCMKIIFAKNFNDTWKIRLKILFLAILVQLT